MIRAMVLAMLIIFSIPIVWQLGYEMLYTVNIILFDNAPIPDGLWVTDILCFLLALIIYIQIRRSDD